MNSKAITKYICLGVIIFLGAFFAYKTVLVNNNDQEQLVRLTSSPEGLPQYVKSGTRVYWTTMQSTQLNSDTFKVYKGDLKPSIYSSAENQYIQYVYATDGKSVYYMDRMLPNGIDGVDAYSFRPIENGNYIHFYGKDDKHVYYKDLTISGANPSTFKILWMVPPEGCMPPRYSKDDTQVFYDHMLVKGADAATFEPLHDDYGKDKDHVFLKEKLQVGVSPANFKVPTTCEYGS